MTKCYEIDGPGVACFCDGKDIVEYYTMRFAATHPATVRDLVVTLGRTIDSIKERSEVIVWRLRPTISFKYTDKRSVETDGFPSVDDYKNGLASIRIRCRIGCYPALSNDELALFMVRPECEKDISI
jgi:hypothetical protein